MTSEDTKSLRDWLRRPTVMPTVLEDPQPEQVSTEHIWVDFRETEVAKLHFFYPDLSSLCIKLAPDGTWTYTVGQ